MVRFTLVVTEQACYLLYKGCSFYENSFVDDLDICSSTELLWCLPTWTTTVR